MSGHGFWSGLGRGFVGRCPNCGHTGLLRRYLKVASPCTGCGHDNAQYPSDDAPPYFTILLVGHLVIAPLVLLPVIWTAPAGWVVGLSAPAVAALTLALLPRVKGAVIGAQWAIRRNEGVVPGQQEHSAWAPTPPDA